MTRELAYVKHRYGRYKVSGGGQMQTRGRKGNKIMTPTERALGDKLRYIETRFKGESNTLYTDQGEIVGGHKDAWDFLESEAHQIALTNEKNRSKHTSFIYDSTINTGDLDHLSEQDLHLIVEQFLDQLREAGHRISKPIYAIHTNTQHHHIHLLFASHSTIRKRTNKETRIKIREIADHQKELSRKHDKGHAV